MYGHDNYDQVSIWRLKSNVPIAYFASHCVQKNTVGAHNLNFMCSHLASWIPERHKSVIFIYLYFVKGLL